MLDSADENVQTFGFDAPTYGGCLALVKRQGDEVFTEIQFIKYEVVAFQVCTIKIGPKAGSSGTWHAEYAARIAISLFLNPSLDAEMKEGKVVAKSVAPWQGEVK
ncbi:hypothetical protein [Janthinobacterium lividum]|uniref:hypothetical protein n=1 Tax=Janthinobacterium lividum TaxID=29581 RepID=UPI00159600EE|nr:hypothetical protein [Janthinobacterium lividum]QKY09549.1 hypothetical protein G8765_18545 [Janthinobacterium lividum]